MTSLKGGYVILPIEKLDISNKIVECKLNADDIRKIVSIGKPLLLSIEHYFSDGVDKNKISFYCAAKLWDDDSITIDCGFSESLDNVRATLDLDAGGYSLYVQLHTYAME